MRVARQIGTSGPHHNLSGAVSPCSSTLASIFGTSRAMDAGGNASLTYTAPKQPKKQSKCKPIVELLNVCVSMHVCVYMSVCVCVHMSVCKYSALFHLCSNTRFSPNVGSCSSGRTETVSMLSLSFPQAKYSTVPGVNRTSRVKARPGQCACGWAVVVLQS